VDLLAATAPVPTPALVVDLGAARRNAARAVAALDGARPRLRPHFKAHKCTRLLALQLAAGDCAGVTCATAHEAAVVAAAGVSDDVLVANEVADAAGLAALGRAARQARVTACADDPRHVELLAATAAAAGVAFDVLVEVDVGQRRCGVAPGTGAALALARLVAAAPGLAFRGLQGYEGHAVLLTDRAKRAGHVTAAAALLAAERAELEGAGLPCRVVSGGGTGTLDLAAEAGVLDEVQAGSYVLMDASYGRLGLGFEQALHCRATVVSRRGDRAVLDAGLKALSAEYGMPSDAAGGLEVTALADEHATATVMGAGPAPEVGEAVLLVPAHVDPTVNLHGTLHVVGEDGGVEAWPVDGRRG
jgi:D-serine deaminase-like pyridoxal phosphate-dependent protein